MDITRRNNVRGTNSGTAADILNRLAIDPKPIRAHASDLEFEDVREVSSICPLCSENCRYIAHVKDGSIVSAESDPSYSVNESALCEKGVAMLSKMAVTPNT